MMYSTNELKALMFDTLDRCHMEYDEEPAVIVHKLEGFRDLLELIAEAEAKHNV